MLYVGLDVSMRRTAVCVLDAMGKVMREASVETAPETIAAAIRSAGGEVERVGLEAGMGSSWLARGLLAAGLPVIVIEAAHAAGALRTGFPQQDRSQRRPWHCRPDARQQVSRRLGEVAHCPARPLAADGA